MEVRFCPPYGSFGGRGVSDFSLAVTIRSSGFGWDHSDADFPVAVVADEIPVMRLPDVRGKPRKPTWKIG